MISDSKNVDNVTVPMSFNPINQLSQIFDIDYLFNLGSHGDGDVSDGDSDSVIWISDADMSVRSYKSDGDSDSVICISDIEEELESINSIDGLDEPPDHGSMDWLYPEIDTYKYCIRHWVDITTVVNII